MKFVDTPESFGHVNHVSMTETQWKDHHRKLLWISFTLYAITAVASGSIGFMIGHALN